MNIAYLEKHGRKNIDFCLLEITNGLLNIKIGKNNKVISSMTRNCGSDKEALEDMQSMIIQYQENGYKIKEKPIVDEEIIFDKAKWHFNNDFPKDLDDFHAYIHTGFFIGWLINKNLISEACKQENKNGIDAFLNGKITGSQFYKQYLDGVFTSNDVSALGLKFVRNYFDFENGFYLRDYEKALASELPSIYHVDDIKECEMIISEVITKRFEEYNSAKI